MASSDTRAASLGPGSACADRRPKRLRIGHLTYPVRWVDYIPAPPENSECVVLGHTHLCEPICIEVTDSAPSEQETLLHEALHAIFNDRAIGEVVGESEEFLVSTLACGLVQMLRSNKGLGSWLAGEGGK